MIHIHWQDEDLAVQRIVISPDSHRGYRHSLIPLARQLGLVVADDNSDPRPGDFWIGCHPVRGWGDANPSQIGWASLVEAPIAVGVLLELGRRQRAWVADGADTPLLV